MPRKGWSTDGWLQVIRGPRPPSTKWPRAKPVFQKPNVDVVHPQPVTMSSSKVSVVRQRRSPAEVCAVFRPRFFHPVLDQTTPRNGPHWKPRWHAPDKWQRFLRVQVDCRHRGVYHTCAEVRRCRSRNRSSCSRRSWPRQRKIWKVSVERQRRSKGRQNPSGPHVIVGGRACASPSRFGSVEGCWDRPRCTMCP